MPGAPNRPPEKSPETAPPAPPSETKAQRALRRLAPSRVALLLEPWKGSPAPELMTPFDKAESAYAAGDFEGALSALDALSIRLAEPRWPTLPEPFRRLRVRIPAPMPPHWDPEHALPPAEKEASRARKAAGDQLDLATAALNWGRTHGIDTGELDPVLAEASALLPGEGPSTGFYERIDRIWAGVRERFPRPKGAAARAPTPSVPTAEVGEA